MDIEEVKAKLLATDTRFNPFPGYSTEVIEFLLSEYDQLNAELGSYQDSLKRVNKIYLGEREKAGAESAELRGIIEEVNSWAVCAAIASPGDMAQNFPRIVEITTLGMGGVLANG